MEHVNFENKHGYMVGSVWIWFGVGSYVECVRWYEWQVDFTLGRPMGAGGALEELVVMTFSCLVSAWVHGL
jgi:hypothetical protein